MYAIALSPTTTTEFLDYILCHHVAPTTLVVCDTREAFIESLQIDIQAAQCNNQYTEPDNDSRIRRHQFLLPTINLIAASRNVNLAFTPTLLHLRAYLAAYAPKGVPSTDALCTTSRRPTLAIWGLIKLHRTTIEYSMQSISRTLTTAVEAAYLSCQRLVLGELPVGSDHVDIMGAERTQTTELWSEKVPLLNGGVRSALGFSTGVGKTIELRRVIGRWCRFVMVQNAKATDDTRAV